MNGVEAPPIGGLVRTALIVVAVLFAGWLLLAWVVIKRPLLGIPAAIFVGLVLLVGCMMRRPWRSTSWARCWCGAWRTARDLTVWSAAGCGVAGCAGGSMSAVGVTR